MLANSIGALKITQIHIFHIFHNKKEFEVGAE